MEFELTNFERLHIRKAIPGANEAECRGIVWMQKSCYILVANPNWLLGLRPIEGESGFGKTVKRELVDEMVDLTLFRKSLVFRKRFPSPLIFVCLARQLLMPRQIKIPFIVRSICSNRRFIMVGSDAIVLLLNKNYHIVRQVDMDIEVNKIRCNASLLFCSRYGRDHETVCLKIGSDEKVTEFCLADRWICTASEDFVAFRGDNIGCGGPGVASTLYISKLDERELGKALAEIRVDMTSFVRDVLFDQNRMFVLTSEELIVYCLEVDQLIEEISFRIHTRMEGGGDWLILTNRNGLVTLGAIDTLFSRYRLFPVRVETPQNENDSRIRSQLNEQRELLVRERKYFLQNAKAMETKIKEQEIDLEKKNQLLKVQEKIIKSLQSDITKLQVSRISEISHVAPLPIRHTEIEYGPIIGKGGAAIVMKAVLHQPGNPSLEVAVKRLETPTQISVEALRRESSVMSSCFHPNVLSLIGIVAGENGESFDLVFPLMRYSLVDVIHKSCAGKLELQDKINLSLKIAIGMEYLHSLGILHRDLKPGNILIGPEGLQQPKICDFGLSRYLSHTTSTKQLVGSPSYMPPELLSRQVISMKGDVYSFGVVLNELFSAKSPFPGIPLPSILAGVGFGDLRPVIDSGVPDGVQQLIKQCWKKESNDRPTFSEISRLLSSFDVSSSI